MNRKKLLLFILLVSFAISLGYGYLRMPRQKTVEKLTFLPGGRAPARGGITAKPDEKKLHLELLEGGGTRFAGFRRNIFRPIFYEELKPLPSLPPPPPVPPVKPPPPPPPVAQAPAEPMGPPAPPPPPPPPQYVTDMKAFTFLGFMKKDNRKTIFLSKKGDIFLVKKGDKIDQNKYEVTNITDEVLTINVLAEGREIIMPLEENKTLMPVK